MKGARLGHATNAEVKQRDERLTAESEVGASEGRRGGMATCVRKEC